MRSVYDGGRSVPSFAAIVYSSLRRSTLGLGASADNGPLFPPYRGYCLPLTLTLALTLTLTLTLH